MEYNKLYLFIEGDDDERFFKSVLFKKFLEKYQDVQIWKYAVKTNEQRRRFIDIINKVDNWEYFCFRDFDFALCITNKKQRLINKLNRIAPEKIIIIIKEIESWYLAGIDNDFLRNIKAKLMDRNCSEISKEMFDKLIPKKMPRIVFMRKILQNYNIKLAMENNSSFAYFMHKIL